VGLDKSKSDIMDKKSGMTIFTAAAKGKIRVMRQFNSEVLGLKDKRGRTPLMYAARHGKFLPVAHLVYHGVSLNDIDETGHTALMRAAERGHRCVFQYLLIEGADATIINLQGQTAYDIAVRSKQLAIVDILTEWSQMESKVLKTEKKESKALRFAVAPDIIPYVLFPEEAIDLALSTPPVSPPPPPGSPPPISPPPGPAPPLFESSSKSTSTPTPSIPPFTGPSSSTSTAPTSRSAPPGFFPPPLLPSSSLSRLPSSVLSSSPPQRLPSTILSQSPTSQRLPSSILSVSHNQGPSTLSHFVFEPNHKMSS